MATIIRCDKADSKIKQNLSLSLAWKWTLRDTIDVHLATTPTITWSPTGSPKSAQGKRSGNATQRGPGLLIAIIMFSRRDGTE